MKRIIIGLLLCGAVTSCVKTVKAPKASEFKTITIDSCEYIIRSESRVDEGYGYMAHKGNCKFCKKRK